MQNRYITRDYVYIALIREITLSPKEGRLNGCMTLLYGNKNNEYYQQTDRGVSIEDKICNAKYHDVSMCIMVWLCH